MLIQWLADHYVALLGAALAVSEGLALLFPPESGVAGILQGLMGLIRRLLGQSPPALK